MSFKIIKLKFWQKSFVSFNRRMFGRLYTVRISDQLSYRGSWRTGLFHGYGVLAYEKGGVYEGDFRFGVKHGRGLLSSSTGFRYNGEWADGEPTGSAKISYKNGDWYDGEVINGVRHGWGELSELSSQRVFEGLWEKGSLVGKVTITSQDWTYSGTIPNKSRQASGHLRYSNGSIYVGSITNFTRHGVGKLTSPSGNQIAGFWLDDKNVNYAISTDSEGIQWYGTLKDLKPDGFMKVRLPNGEKYDGMWKNGQMQRVLSIKNKRNAPTTYHFY